MVNGACGDKTCIFEFSSRIDKITLLDFALVILKLVLRGTGSSLYLHIIKASRFRYVAATPEAVTRVVSSFLFGFMSDVHGNALKKHISCLVKVRIAAALDEAPDVVLEWQVRRDIFTGTSFFVHEPILRRKKVRPLANPCTVTSLF